MTKTISLDLASLDTRKACNEPFALNVKHPVTKAETGIIFWLLGVDADAVQEFVDERNNRSLRQAASLRKRGEEPEVPTVEKQLDDNIEFWAVCIYGSQKPWENMVFQGKSLEFTPANIKMVLKELKWLRPQVDAAIGNLENFMRT